ncbi:MAG: glucose/arabinose dehydrogenase [Cyclobacteriaceae bacterium]|jgi:glucose/arabinose dehydrogenase
MINQIRPLANLFFIICLALIVVNCSNSGNEPTLFSADPVDETVDDPIDAPIDEPLSEVPSDSLLKVIYVNNCSGCHGQRMESFIERDWKYGSSSENILNSIKVGYPENGMPAYGATFSEEELAHLSDFILTSIEGKTKASLLDENPDLSGLITSDDLSFRLETLTDEISGIPWAITQLSNGDLLVTDRGGKLYRITTENQLETIAGIPSVQSSGQGGLLDVEIHPDFSNNQLIYLSYSQQNPQNASQATTAVARGKLIGNDLTEVEDIFIALPYHSTNRHYGSRLLFDNAGYLYVSVGDRGSRDNFPQALNNQLGKVHRLNDDGSIPTDNPFVNDQNAESSIYAYGIRNPQGLSLHPETGDVWEGEHGPQGGDEINMLNAGRNYGWPVISYGINYNGTPFTDLTEKEGMEQPVHYWVPSIAPCGMDFVSGDFYAGWKSDLMVSSLKFEYLHRLKMDGNLVIGQEELLKGIGRIRDVHMGRDGYLYIAVEGPARVIRLIPHY